MSFLRKVHNKCRNHNTRSMRSKISLTICFII
nr:MAG TPA: hypothetical protein [Bacteriophage sp.]